MTSGLRFHAVDLHVHTPASRCFGDKSVTAEQIVQAAIDAGLYAIAVTDHNSPAFIDSVQAAAKGRLVVFPGVEITAQGGEGGVHVIGLFDVGESSEKVKYVLSRIGVSPHEYGNHSALAEGICEVIREIQDAGGIAILAHAQSSKGAMADIKGASRTAVFNERGLLAVEVSDSDFDEGRRLRRTRAVDLLDGNDPNYGNRKLAVIQGSDCFMDDSGVHCLAGVGARRTFVKTAEPLMLEGLRQAFIDPDSRIRLVPLHGAPVTSAYPRIERVAVTGGFLDGLDLSLHPGMNSFIGGKGSGKSLLVELMRFALGSEPTQDDILRDHLSKLDRRLGRYGKVTLDLADQAGTRHTIIRTYDPPGGNPYVDDDQELSASEFPVLFLSQNEIVRIAESDEEQLQFIDRFLDFRTHQRSSERLSGELAALDEALAKALRALRRASELRQQEATLVHRLKTLDKQLANPAFSSFSDAAAKAELLADHSTQAEAIAALLGAAEQRIGHVANPDIPEGLTDDPAVKRAAAALESLRDLALDELALCKEKVRTSAEAVDAEKEKFAPTLAAKKVEYETMVAASGGDYKALTGQRDAFRERLAGVRATLLEVKGESDALRPIAEQRKGKLKEFGDAQAGFSRDRQAKCQQIEAYSGGRLKVSVVTATDTSEFARQLSAMKKGSYLPNDEIEAITTNITPHNFVATLLNYEAAGSGRKGEFIDRLAKMSTIKPDRVRQLADFLLESRSYEEILGLQHRANPADRPEIRVQVADDVYEPLAAVSTGQKCTALLIMALGDSEAPVVIDQPEDSLDLRSIWQDMCVKLRSGKDQRQFVCTTHNSSLAVASDTDCYVVLEADAEHGHVSEVGAIDTEAVKSYVIDYLEGGVQTYTMKYRKYDMDRHLR